MLDVWFQKFIRTVHKRNVVHDTDLPGLLHGLHRAVGDRWTLVLRRMRPDRGGRTRIRHPSPSDAVLNLRTL